MDGMYGRGVVWFYDVTRCSSGRQVLSSYDAIPETSGKGFQVMVTIEVILPVPGNNRIH